MSLFTNTTTPPEEMLSRGLLLLGISALAGLLVAGLAFPVVGGLGLVARSGGNSFQSLPSELSTPPLPQRSRLLAADGKTVLATIYLNENRVVVPLSDIPDLTRKAVLAIEDARYYQHGGIDLQGILRAGVTNASSGAVEQGGSTITQQYVKNVLIEKATTKKGKQAAKADTLSRKLREARFALALENKLTKNQILERYLNIAFFGNGVYGIGTAAQHYYGKSVKDLTIQESAMLAGLIRNPAAYDLTAHPAAALARRNTVLGKMAELEFISPSQEAAARRAPLDPHITTVDNGCGGSSAAYFCQWLLREAQDDPAFGATREERVARLFQGGLTIYTTLQPKLQQTTQDALDKAIPPTDPSGVATATAIVQPGTGHVLAMAQDRRFGDDKAAGQTKVNYATGGITGFQAGSTFKAFTLSAALQKGLPLSTSFYAPTCYHSSVLDNPDSGCFRNAGDSESGTFSIPEGTWDSVNTFYVQLEEKVGVLTAAHLAEAMGITGLPFGGKTGITKRSGSFTLGAYETNPLDMATAYATLAAHGMHCVPTGIAKVLDANGDPVAGVKPRCNRVLEPGVADTATSVLQGVIDGPASGRTGKGLSIGRPAAGKTGTTQNFGAAWFVGYTPAKVSAVWVGNPKGLSNALTNVTINGKFYSRIYGATLAGPIWQAVMLAAVKGDPVQMFNPADPEVVNGKQVNVPDVSGKSLSDAKDALTAAGFSVAVGSPVDRVDIPAGQVADSSPGVGTSANVGTTVTIHLSTGVAPPPVVPVAPPPVAPVVPGGPGDTFSPSLPARPTGPSSPTGPGIPTDTFSPGGFGQFSPSPAYQPGTGAGRKSPRAGG